MEPDILNAVDWSRAQFALTAIYHWLFVPLTLGLGYICAIMETIYYRTGDERWKKCTRFWLRLFGVNFAIGVATGLILEFEFGTNWSNYSHFVGDIFGAPLAIEGIMAFFLESTFVAVVFFGWEKVSRRFHLLSTWLTAIGASLSAVWILVANSWMQYPVGMTFNLDTVRNEMTSFWEVALSPVALNKFTHTVSSALLLSAVFVVGVSAWMLLRKRSTAMAKRSISVASAFGVIFGAVTAFSGDRSGAIVAEVQPMKLAAMEALYDGEQGAPLSVIGLICPQQKSGRIDAEQAFKFNIEIPKLLSIMSFRDAEAYVAGINDLVYGNERYGIMSASEKIERGRRAIDELARYRDARRDGDEATAAEIRAKFDPETEAGKVFLTEYFAYLGYGYLSSPEQIIPCVPLLYYSFRIMVGAGMFLLLLLVAVWWFNRRDTLAGKRWLLWVALCSIPLAYLASQLGWVIAEVGRQPWAIQDLMPVTVAASDLSSGSVATTFFIFLALFTALLAAEIGIMIGQIKSGTQNE